MWVKTKKNKQWIPVFHCYNRSTTVWKRRDRENPTNHKRGDREAGAGAEQDKMAAPQRLEESESIRPGNGSTDAAESGGTRRGRSTPHAPTAEDLQAGRLGFSPPKSWGEKGEKRCLAQMSSQGDSTGRLLWLGGSRGDSRSGWYHKLFQTQSLNRSIWSQLSKK